MSHQKETPPGSGEANVEQIGEDLARDLIHAMQRWAKKRGKPTVDEPVPVIALYKMTVWYLDRLKPDARRYLAEKYISWLTEWLQKKRLN
jgi:hypothetical protein